MGKEGNLYVVGSAVISIVATIVDKLFPSSLGEVDFELCSTDECKVLLARVTQSESTRQPWVQILLDGRAEVYFAEVITSVESYGKVAAQLAYLSK
jgi:hypothetical protein